MSFLNITVFKLTIVYPWVFFISSIPFLEISNWIRIYFVTNQLTSLDKIFYNIVRKLKSLTITCPFNKLIYTFWIFVNCRNISIIVFTYLFANVWSNAPDSILFNMNIYVSVSFFMLFYTINLMNNLKIVVRP